MDPIVKEMKLKEQRDIKARCGLGILVGLFLAPFGVGILIVILAAAGMSVASKRVKEIESEP